MDDKGVAAGYPHRVIDLPAFDLLGFTKIVRSGGEQYGEVRKDGRWEVLRRMVGADGSIYGVASMDSQCPRDHYRYTLAVRTELGNDRDERYESQLFPFHVKASKWVEFALEHFGRQYGEFWGSDPYKMIQELGYSFNRALSIHIDLFPATYITDDDAMQFLMPVES